MCTSQTTIKELVVKVPYYAPYYQVNRLLVVQQHKAFASKAILVVGISFGITGLGTVVLLRAV